MVGGYGTKKNGKINGAQETKGCREVKGQEEDEQCACGISQPAKFLRLRKFTNLEISHYFKKSSPTATLAKIEKRKL